MHVSCHPLEPRLLFSVFWKNGTTLAWSDASLSLRWGVLRIDAGPRNDKIRVGVDFRLGFPFGGLTLVSKTMRVQIGSHSESIPLSVIDGLQIDGGGGDDLVLLGPLPLTDDACDRLYSTRSLWRIEKPARIDGGDGNDTIVGTTLPDTIFGGPGDDQLYGQRGNDEIFAMAGDDFVRGGIGHDLIHGGAGNDILLGGDGRDTLRGNNGNDQIRGGSDLDQIWGGTGDDKYSEPPGNLRSIEELLTPLPPAICPL